VDVTGLKCPVPLLKAATAIKMGRKGYIFEIIAADPAFGQNIRIWCNHTGFVLEDVTQKSGKTHAIIKNDKE